MSCSSPMSASTRVDRTHARASARRRRGGPRAPSAPRARAPSSRPSCRPRSAPRSRARGSRRRGAGRSARPRPSSGWRSCSSSKHAVVVERRARSRRARRRGARARRRGRARRAHRAPHRARPRGPRPARRAPAQHAARLALDRELGLLQPVVELDQRLGLDEERGARGRRVVHDARHAPARLGAHGQHVAVAAHGDEGVLERVAKLRDPRAGRSTRSCTRRGGLARLAARGRECGRGGVAHLPVAVRARPRSHPRARRGSESASALLRQQRRLGAPARQEARRLGHRARGAASASSSRRRERAALREPGERGVDLGRRAERRRRHPRPAARGPRWSRRGGGAPPGRSPRRPSRLRPRAERAPRGVRRRRASRATTSGHSRRARLFAETWKGTRAV